MKRQPTEWEKIKIKKTIQLNRKKKKTLIEKWAEELNRLFSQRGHTYGQQVHGKMLNITNHQEMQNRNYKEISPHT